MDDEGKEREETQDNGGKEAIAEENKGGLTTRDGRQCAIFYSLGNFICNQNYTYPVKGRKDRLDIRSSFMPRLKILKSANGVKGTVTVVPIVTLHEMKNTSRREYKDIQTVSIPLELARLAEESKTADAKRRAAIDKEAAFYRWNADMVKYVLFRKGPVAGVEFRGE